MSLQCPDKCPDKCPDQCPDGCPDDIWSNFLTHCVPFSQTTLHSPDLIVWNELENCLEVSFATLYMTFFIDKTDFSCCDHCTGTWYKNNLKILQDKSTTQ